MEEEGKFVRDGGDVLVELLLRVVGGEAVAEVVLLKGLGQVGEVRWGIVQAGALVLLSSRQSLVKRDDGRLVRRGRERTNLANTVPQEAVMGCGGGRSGARAHVAWAGRVPARPTRGALTDQCAVPSAPGLPLHLRPSAVGAQSESISRWRAHRIGQQQEQHLLQAEHQTPPAEAPGTDQTQGSKEARRRAGERHGAPGVRESRVARH